MSSQMKFTIFSKFFLLRCIPTSYKMAPNELKMVPNIVLAILIQGYLELNFL